MLFSQSQVKQLLDVQEVTTPEGSVKRGFWVVVSSILKKKKEKKTFCLQVSDINFPQGLSRPLCSVILFKFLLLFSTLGG